MGQNIDKRLVINDNFYQPKPSVFNRLRPIKSSNQDEIREGHKRANVEPCKPSKRLSIDTSDPFFLATNVQKQSSIKVTYTSLNKESITEVTKNPQPSQSTNQRSRGTPKSGTSENSRPPARLQTNKNPAPSPVLNQPKPFR